MFPQPGDSESVIRQKAQLREVAVDGMRKAVGPGYKPSSTTAPGLPSGWSVKVN